MGRRKGWKDQNLFNDGETEGVQKPDREFMFGLSLHLGYASSNYAEYAGVILAQIISSMFKQTDITIKTDAELLVN